MGQDLWQNWQDKRGHSDMTSLNMYRNPIFVSRSVRALATAVTKTRPKRNHALLNLSLKVVISWTCSVLIVGVSRQVLLRSVIPELVHPEGIPSGTYSKTHWTSEPRTFYMSGLNVIIYNRTSLRVERTVQTMPNSKFIFLHASQNGFIKSWINEGKDTLKHFILFTSIQFFPV